MKRLEFKPHDYQRAAIDHVLNNASAGLFLDMGLGKTVITLSALSTLIYEELEIAKVLIVAPKRVIESTWVQEAEKWEHTKLLTFSVIAGNQKQRLAAIKAKADVYLVSRDNIAWLAGVFGGKSMPFDMLVLDELSSFKSSKSQRFKALRGVLPAFDRVVGLTGTPSPNGLQDLWAQVYLLDQGQRLYKRETTYRDEFFNKYEFAYKIRNKECANEIHRRIADLCISMSAKDFLNLPKRIDNVVNIELGAKLAKQYEEFEEERIMELVTALGAETEVTAMHTATLCNKLLQFANGAVYNEDREVCELHDLKLDALEEIVDTANGQPVLVAWAYQHDRSRIIRRLGKYKPRELKTDKDIRDWNAGKVPVMLAHPASAGHGLNLQAGGNIIVWFGLTWSLELYQQFNARLHRQGQQNGVIVHHLVAKGTMDERVMLALGDKEKGQSDLMEAVRARINKFRTK